ncbi:hypothetical protein R5R35_007158 [Gryllus longicercus]|uniref:Microtubule-associated protein futsch n=1 Tax=Gryllus longicercus TaxID=2509291 RepID=A0AAN9V824_9ORTH
MRVFPLAGFLSWDMSAAHVDLEKELQALAAQAPEGEEARNGERLIQYATENLVTEVLIHPQVNTLLQCVRNLLSSFTRHRHLVHAGYTFAGSGSWCLQDGTFSLADFIDAFQESEVQRVLRAYENCVTVDIHCSPEGDWTSERLSKETFSRLCKVRVNPDDCLTAGSAPIANFINYLSPFLRPASIEQLLEPSDVVGNIRFSHPTLYVFPGGQGDAALFGINGFNMLVDGGFARKACFWDFARHLDRLDAVLITRLNNGNVNGISAVLRRKKQGHVYPQIGHFFCNVQERRHCASPDGDKDRDPLLINLADEGHEMVLNLRQLQLRPHACYREGNQVEPVNLYHKVGHGKLDMYIISPARDSREVKEFLAKWNSNDPKLFSNIGKKDSSKEFHFPLQNLISICALLVWQPANPNDTITRILFPGSTPQHKIFEGLEKLRHLEFLKFPVCSARSLSPSSSTVGISSRASSKQRTAPAVIDKLLPGEGVKTSRPTSEVNKHASKAATIPVAGSMPEPKPTKASTPVSSAPAPPISKAPQAKPKAEKTPKSEIKPKTDAIKSTETEKASAKSEKTTKVSVDATKTKVEHKSKVETKTTKSRTDSKPPRSTERKIQKAGSTEKKTDMKSSPTTPKKSVEAKVNGVASKSEPAKSTRPSSKTRPSPSATPAKSTKEANNRKVVESKYHVSRASTTRASASKTTKKETPEAPKTERKPISRRPKTGSPTKAPSGSRPPGSPAKSSSAKSTPTPSVKSEKDGVIRKTKAETERLTTDSSAVSTPSTVDPETALLKAKGVEPEDKHPPLMNGDLTKEEKTVVQEIEDAIAAEEAKAVEQEVEEESEEQVKEVVQTTEAVVEATDVKEGETAVEEEITKEEEDDEEEDEVEEEERIKEEVVESVQSVEAQEETEREADEEEEGEVEEKESEVIEDEVQLEKQTLEKEEVEATEEEQTEDMEDMEEDEAPIDIRESLQAELELEAKRGEVAEERDAEEEEEEEYLVIEKEEVEQAEESMQEPESLESHVPEDGGVREVETEEDEGELQKHLRDEADSEKLKRIQEGEVKVNGFHHEPEEQVHEEEIVKELDVTIAQIKDEAEIKEDIGKAIEKELASSVQQKEAVKEEVPPAGIADTLEKGKEETVLKKDEEPTALEESKPEGIPQEAKEQIQEEVQEIISSAKEIVSKTKLESEKKPEVEEVARIKDQSKDESAEDKKETEEVSSTSPEEKLDVSSEKNKEMTEDTRDTDQKFEEQDEAVEVKETGSKEILDQKYPAEESQPDEKFSTTVESAATTAPTLPEDERIPLDEIKEIVEEKYVKEETKEKEKPVEVVPRFEQPTTLPQVVIPTGIGLFDQHPHHPIIHRDIVKTPDEVADLPVHEEVDPGTYDSEEYPREISKQKPEVEDIKSPEVDVKEELPLKYEEVSKPTHEEKEGKELEKEGKEIEKEGKEIETVIPEPVVASQPDDKDITEKVAPQMAIPDDLIKTDKKFETEVDSQKVTDITDEVAKADTQVDEKEEKELPLKPEQELKEEIPETETKADEVVSTQAPKDSQKPQEISVTTDLESKEKDIKKDDPKTERKTEAVETPQSEISDIESKDKDTEKGMFKEQEKEVILTEVKDITSQFISHERVSASGEIDELRQEDIPKPLETEKDEQKESETVEDEKKDVTTVSMPDDIPQKEEKISTEVASEEPDKDIKKPDEKEILDTDSKLTKDISSDLETKEVKLEESELPEVVKSTETAKEPGILGDSSALSATYLEIIEKLQQDAPDSDTDTSTALKEQEPTTESEKDAKTQEQVKDTDAKIAAILPEIEDIKDDSKEAKTTEVKKDEAEKFEEKEIKGAKIETDIIVSTSDVADEILKDTIDIKREVIDLQEHTEKVKEVAPSYEKEILKEGEDTDDLKKSTPYLEDDIKSLTQEKEASVDTKESSTPLDVTQADDEKKLKDTTEITKSVDEVAVETAETMSIATKESEKEEVIEKQIKEIEPKIETTTQDIISEKEIKSQEKGDKISIESEERPKEEISKQVTSTKEDKVLEEPVVEAEAKIIAEKDISTDKKEESPEHKVQEISTDKILTEDEHKTEQKEIIETTAIISEAEKDTIEMKDEVIEAEKIMDFGKETIQLKEVTEKEKSKDQIEETDLVEVTDAQELTKSQEPSFKVETEDLVKIEEKQSAKDEEKEDIQISEKSSTLAEKEDKKEDKEIILPSSTLDSIEDQASLETVHKTPETETTPQRVPTEVLQPDDTDVKLVKDSTFIEAVALPSQKDQDISKVDKALKDELTLEQDDSEISKIEKSVSEMQLIEDSFKMEISEKKQEFSEPIKFDIPETEAAKEADVSLMSQAHDEKLQKEEVTVKDIDMHEKEVKGDISETDMAEKDTEKTEIIESKADQKIFIPQETDKVMLPETTIIEKDIQEEDKTESAQKPKEDLSSVSEIKEKITEVSPKQDVCESKESETPAALEQKIEEDTSEVVAVEDKHSDSIPLEAEPESVMSKIPKQEVTEIHDTEIQKQEECIIKESKDVEELISKDDDISRKIDDIKGEPQQSIIHKDEIKPDLEEQVDHKDVDKSEQKSVISEAVKIDSVEQESIPRKESLKTEEKVERDTEITEKDKPIKESDTQQKPSDSEVDAASLVSISDEKAILETQDAKKQQPGLDASEKDVGQKFYDQLEDGTGDGEPPPSPGDEFIDSGLEEEPVFTKLEAPEHPEYVTVTPDSTPASPKALPSFVKAREEEQHQIQETPETDSKIESSKKDVLDDIPKEQTELKDDTKKDEKLEESSQKSQIITEPSGTDDHHIEKPVTETSSKFEDIVSSTTESSATKIASPPKSPLGVSFKEEPFEESKSTSDQDEIKTTKTYDETAIAEAKVLDDSVQAEETVTFTTSVSKTVDDFLAMERKVEDTLRSTVEKSSSEISTSIITVTTQETDLSLSESVKEQKDTKVDADESASVGETIVSSISDTKISEKAEIESSEKEIIKSSKEESSKVYTVSETKMIADDSSKLSSEITSSEIVSVTKSETKPSEYAPVEETTTEVSTVTTETKEVKEVETLKEDSTLSTTVKKMLVTASSEDGGAETVLCATGTIKSIDSKKPETEDIPITSEKTAVEKETFSQVETFLSKEAEEMTKHSVETVQYDSHSDDSSEKSQMKIEKPTHPIVTDVKQTNGHLHESDVDIQSTDEEEIIDGKRIFKTKTIKTTTTTKVVRKSVSESTDSEDEHKDSVTETTEVGDDGKIITRKITRTYHTIVKQGEESDVVKSPSKSIEVKDSESSKLTQEHAEKEGSTTFSEQLVGPETSLASSSATTTTTTVTKVVTGDSDELVSSTTKKVIETDTLKSTTITTTDEHGDVEVKSFKEVTDTKLSSADDTDFSKITTETLLKEARSLATTESETVPTTQTKDSVETLTKHEITETTTSRATFDSTKDTVSSVSKDSSEIEKDTKIRDEPACAVSGPLAVIKKESSDTTRSATPGSDAMSDRDFDVGGPSTPHSDISSGQASRVATNIWGSEGRPGSQHYDSDEEEEGPVSPLSVTSQVAPSPPPPHFDFEMPEHQKSHEIEEKHSTVHVTKEEHTKQSSEIYKGPQQALSSSMTSSFYGSLPAEPPLSPEGITMKGVDPMSASFIMQSEDPKHKSIFSTCSTYTYGEDDVGGSATFEHFSSTSQGVPDDTVDFQQALYEHRAARGEDLTTASTSTTYHYETKVKDTHASPEKTVTYEHTSSSGVNGQRKDHSFKEFTEDYGNGNLAGAKQFEDLMNRNREPGHLESKLNGKSADEYSDFSGPTSTESYSQDVYSKVSTVDPSLLRNGSDEKKTITTTTVTTVTKTSTAEPEVHITTQPLTGPSTAAQAFPEPPQGFGLPSISKTETKKDPIEGWGKPLGLPAPAPPPTNNTNAQGEVMAMTNTNKGTPKKEKKVMQMKKSMIISENNKTTGQMGKDKTKSPESPVKQKAGSNKVGIGNAKSSLAPIYVDLSYVPHHGNSYYTALDFFKKVRARYYVFSGTEPSREVYNALLEAKQTWEDKELEVTIIPTYDTDTLGYWVAENEDALAKCKIDLSPSASRCTINLQDHETSCSAYRLEF